MTQLDKHSLLIIMKYFNTIDDYFNIEKCCKEYNGLIEQFHFNPIPLNNEKERDIFFNNVLNNIKSSDKFIGVYLIGSSSIGFRDIYSDCDFMIAYNKDYDVSDIRDEILTFFDKNEIGYKMERKWSDTIWGISLYMKNGLSSDISFGPLDELKIMIDKFGSTDFAHDERHVRRIAKISEYENQ